MEENNFYFDDSPERSAAKKYADSAKDCNGKIQCSLFEDDDECITTRLEANGNQVNFPAQPGTIIDFHKSPFIYTYLHNRQNIKDGVVQLKYKQNQTWLTFVIDHFKTINPPISNNTAIKPNYTEDVTHGGIKFFKVMQIVSGFSSRSEAHNFCMHWKAKSRSKVNRVLLGLQLTENYKNANPNIFSAFTTRACDPLFGENHPDWREYIRKVAHYNNLSASKEKIKRILSNCPNCKLTTPMGNKFTIQPCSGCYRRYTEVSLQQLDYLEKKLSHVVGTNIFADNDMVMDDTFIY
jgi:hypothetical protein